tara:strand:+ start:105 stop:866 length:762 start_codon:yes stop_codon:yes gene_type:complete
MKIKINLKKFFGFKSDFASLTIVGVGPGDPSLLTIAALDALKKAKVIFFPISNNDRNSISAEIVRKYIRFKNKIPIIFPMARKEFNPDEIWTNAVNKILKFLQNNQSVVLLCLGDPTLFASSSNILRIINDSHPEIITKIIPGISSISGAAALSNTNLALKGETLIIKECPSYKQELVDLVTRNKDKRNVLVLMKVGKRWDWVKDVLKEEDIISKSIIALNLGMSDQVVKNASKFNNNKVPYFSLLLIRFDDE